jgi:tetratricopeptide (TPR) repeat protein
VSLSFYIDPDHFVRLVSPMLAKQDAQGLITLIHRHWTLAQVASLLDRPHAEARKCASVVLSLIGTESCLEALSKQLRDSDAIAAQMAEHAMWSIWLRSGSEAANTHIVRGTHLLQHKDVEGAIAEFTRAIAADPEFAEAYNQRAMALYFKEQIDDSLRDCQRVVELMPMHFGAWSGLGHCHACKGDFAKAVECYRRAKQINPHLECVDDLIAELEAHSESGNP